MVMQIRNKAMSKDITQQTMPTLKKPLMIPSPRPGAGSSTSLNKGKKVNHKQ